MSSLKKICRRCLLEESGNIDLAKAVKERIAVIPENLRADGNVYKKRLEICRSCVFLNAGTCVKCGCYVEIRAAGIDGYCPHEKRFW